MSNYFVLAGGPSVREYSVRELHRHGVLIAANDAALYTRPYAALSHSKSWAKHRLPFIATLGVPRVYLHGRCREDLPSHWHGPPGALKFFGTSRRWPAANELFGENSGVSAFSLALTMAQPQDTIYLLGFDCGPAADGASYWYPEYTWAQRASERDPRKYLKMVDELAELAAMAKARGFTRLWRVVAAELEPFSPVTSLPFNDFRAIAGLN